MLQQRIGLAEENRHLRIAHIPAVVVGRDARSACQHQLVVGESGCRAKHVRQVVFDFLLAAACQQGDDGAGGDPV